MSRERVLPGEVIMDMLRGAPTSGRRVSYLIETGSLFGFSENTVRVTLSRLQARGLIENPERGRYKLAPTADPVNEFVERWRLGERRVRDWIPGSWLFAHIDEVDDRSAWALDALGFRAIRPSLQVRPDNLALTLDELCALGKSIGIDNNVLIIQGITRDRDAETWESLWPCKALEREYDDMISRLDISAASLTSIDREKARLETFKLGGAGIHRLAKDPLLPAEFIDTGKRQQLWQKMIDYDETGKAIWAQNRTEHDNSLPVPRLADAG